MSIYFLAQAQAAPVATTNVTPAAPAATETVPAAGQPAPAEQPSGLQKFLGGDMIMFVLIIVLFWVLLIRPQRKAQKEQQERLAALQRGDKVITNSGIHGFVEKVNERTVSLKIAEGVIIEIEKQAVAAVDKKA